MLSGLIMITLLLSSSLRISSSLQSSSRLTTHLFSNVGKEVSAAMISAQDYSCGETIILPGNVRSTEHFFKVPLDWCNNPEDGSTKTIQVFARELVSASRSKEAAEGLPVVVYLQGGPGFPAARPTRPAAGGWIARALADHRVLLVDQRGTGRSTPVTMSALTQLVPRGGDAGAGGDQSEALAKAQADYLRCFRADSIIKDCEAIRKTLIGDKKWGVLGQSFGGFCLLTYLSFFPDSLLYGLFTGGLAPVLRSPDEVYTALSQRVVDRNDQFYKRYPGAIKRVRKIVAHLDKYPDGVPLPSGGSLTTRRFLQLGLNLGRGSGLEDVYFFTENAFEGEGDNEQLSFSFLRSFENAQGFDTNPIYAILHESIYCEGKASAWSAERVMNKLMEDNPTTFDYKVALEKGDDHPVYFTGEMVFPFMFDGCYSELAPLKKAAELLAADDSWVSLYDKDALAQCPVPCAAAVYYDDMYVERMFSEEVAKLMPNTKIWVTNEYQHSGLSDDGGKIFDRLMGMVKGTVSIPS